MVVGCDSSIEMPLSKEEASQIEGTDKEEKGSFNNVTKQDEGSSAKSEQISEKEDKDLAKKDEEQKFAEKENKQDASYRQGTNSAASVNGGTTAKSEREGSSTDRARQSEKKATANASNKDKENSSKSTREGGSSSAPAEKKSNAKKQDKESTKQTSAKNTIVYSIVISDSEIPLAPTEMEVKEGDTVLDALIRITKEKGIQMDYRGGQGATAYVEGIANVYEFDRGQGSGWMYRVNGIFPDRGAGVVPLLPGDRVEWLYTTDLGKDLGADLQPFRR